jgi:hypothetical protein
MDWWRNEHLILATEFHRVCQEPRNPIFAKNRISPDFMDWWLNEQLILTTEFHRVCQEPRNAKKSDFSKKSEIEGYNSIRFKINPFKS